MLVIVQTVGKKRTEADGRQTKISRALCDDTDGHLKFQALIPREVLSLDSNVDTHDIDHVRDVTVRKI